MKAVIIDDEQDSRDILANYVTKYCDGIEVMGFGENVETGLKAISTHKPDIVFLDVEMPYGNGFDLLAQIGTPDFEVIFVTAFSQYAIQALNLSASYYILKPVDIDELVNSTTKIKKDRASTDFSKHTKTLIDNLQESNKQNQKVLLPLIDGFEIVIVRDIIHCEAQDNFTEFHLADGSKKLICRTLKHYEEALNSAGFMRIHRSHLINLDYVVKYNKGKGGFITLKNGKEIEVSSSKKKAFLNRFH